MRVPFLRASLPPIEAWAPSLQTAYDKKWFSNFGSIERRFAERCAEVFGAPDYEVVPVTNATSGLTATLLGLGIKGRVLLPAFTFAGTLHAIKAAGCLPCLGDVDPQTGELTIAAVEQALSRGPVEAIMPVRAYGFVRNRDDLIAYCSDRNIPVIFDSAAAFGAPGLHGKIGSSLGEIEVFSLHATKTVSVGEGGLIFAPRDVADRIRSVTNFGFRPDRSFGDGGNMKLDEVRAAIGLAALDTAPEIIAHRARIAADYDAALDPWTAIATRPVAPGPTPWQSYPVRFATHEARQIVETALAEKDIETRIYYAPSLSKGYLGDELEGQDMVQTSEMLAETMLCLPIHPAMTQPERDHVLAALTQALGRLS